MQKTNNYTYFAIKSKSIIGDRGLIATKKGVFDATEITKMLDIQPDNSWSYGEEQPWMSFNKEIIEFCYLTGTTIAVDLYSYPEEI